MHHLTFCNWDRLFALSSFPLIQLKGQRPVVPYLGGGYNFNPKGILAVSGDIFGLYNFGMEVYIY